MNHQHYVEVLFISCFLFFPHHLLTQILFVAAESVKKMFNHDPVTWMEDVLAWHIIPQVVALSVFNVISFTKNPDMTFWSFTQIEVVCFPPTMHSFICGGVLTCRCRALVRFWCFKLGFLSTVIYHKGLIGLPKCGCTCFTKKLEMILILTPVCAVDMLSFIKSSLKGQGKC